MKNVKYEFSSTHINLPESLAEKVINWGNILIPDDEIFQDPDNPSFGRENDPHVTLLYGIHDEDPDKVQKLLQDHGPVRVKLDKTEVFLNDAFDVVHLRIISSDLRKLNKKLRDNIEFTNSYTDYRPHATIAYVKKGKGWKYRGDQKWSGEEFTADSFIFSSKNGKKTSISLK